MATSYGSKGSPVKLDPWQTIVKAHWPSGPAILSVWYDVWNGSSWADSTGNYLSATNVANAVRLEENEEVPIHITSATVGARVALPGGMPPLDETWTHHSIESTDDLPIIEWGGWMVRSTTSLYSFDEQIIIRLDHIAEIAGTENFKIQVACRAGVRTIVTDNAPGKTRVLARTYSGDASYKPNLFDRLGDPNESFRITGKMKKEASLPGLTLDSVIVSGSHGDILGMQADVIATVTYDNLTGAANLTVT